jgi:hypothetical protein
MKIFLSLTQILKAMSGFPILDLVIGMIFIYFLLSVISSSAVEMILSAAKARSKVLEEWLNRIFDTVITEDGKQRTVGQVIMDHCAVIALSEKGRAPSYIDAKNFTSALIEKITYDPQNPKSIASNIDDIITALKNTTLLSTEMQRALLGYAYEARDTYAALSVKTISEIEYFRSKVENWFDSSMDRLTGTFKKRYSRPFTLLVAVIVAVALNADSVSIAKYLYSNPDARANIVAEAYQEASDSTYIKRLNSVHTSTQDSVTLQQIKNEMDSSLQNINKAKGALASDIPLGWKSGANNKITPILIITKITGLLATILAIFMGAPFWFDLLNKIANLRSSGTKPPSSTDPNDKN